MWEAAVAAELGDLVGYVVAGPSGGVDACGGQGIGDRSDVVMGDSGYVVAIPIHAAVFGHRGTESVGQARCGDLSVQGRGSLPAFIEARARRVARALVIT